MIKLNLIIDGNFLMMKSVFTLHKNKILEELPNVLEKDFSILSNLFVFNKIYLISDSKRNWRRDYFPEHKMSRKKNDKIDWDYVFEKYSEFQEMASEKRNCEFCKIDNLEGDDLIAYITKESNKNGISNLIIANDSDLFQLIYQGENFINMMHNFLYTNDRLYMPQNYEIYIDKLEREFEDDLFETHNDMDFVRMVKSMTQKSNVTLIDSEYELFSKIVGHNKDNITSIYLNGNRGIGKKGTLTLYNLYKSLYSNTIDFNSDEFKNNLLFVLKNFKRIKNNDSDNKILENIKRNLILVKLDEISMPDNLYKMMSDEIKIY